VKLERKSMTSFCRRVIAMRMIVANKKRIASEFLKIYLLEVFKTTTDAGGRTGDMLNT
jgi:hypothetical protein